MTISEVIHIAWMSAEISEFHLGGWWQQVLNTNCVLVCSSKTNCLVEDEKKALWAGNTLLSVCVCLREREMKWMFVSHHYLDLDFPKAVYKALNLCVCLCQERRARQWSWRMWSFISVFVCHALRTTVPSLSSPLTARASSCPTASTLQWGHINVIKRAHSFHIRSNDMTTQKVSLFYCFCTLWCSFLLY